MQKSCCIISLMAMFLMFFISCTNEEFYYRMTLMARF